MRQVGHRGLPPSSEASATTGGAAQPADSNVESAKVHDKKGIDAFLLDWCSTLTDEEVLRMPEMFAAVRSVRSAPSSETPSEPAGVAEEPASSSASTGNCCAGSGQEAAAPVASPVEPAVAPATYPAELAAEESRQTSEHAHRAQQNDDEPMIEVEEPPQELRQGRDGIWYTREQFRRYYGSSWASRWHWELAVLREVPPSELLAAVASVPRSDGAGPRKPEVLIQPNCMRCHWLGSGVKLDSEGRVVRREPICLACRAIAPPSRGYVYDLLFF